MEGADVKRSEKGSVTIEATIVISIVLLFLFGSLGTLLTVFVDTQMEWAIQNASDEMSIRGIPFSDQKVVLNGMMLMNINDEIEDRSIDHFVEIKTLRLEEFKGHNISLLEVSYDYKFVTFIRQQVVQMPFMSGDVNDRLKFESSTVYITTYGEKYHMQHCFHLRKSKLPIDIDEAVYRGYEPCKNCHKSIESR